MPLGWGLQPAPFLLNNSVKYGRLLMALVGDTTRRWTVPPTPF